MNAMILAAGRGERLKPFTDHCPKPLLEVQGRPLIEYHLLALVEAGITRVVVNTCWLGEKIEQTLGDGNRFGLEISYSRETDALETAGGIIQALPYLDDRFIVINADIFTDYALQNLLEIKSAAHLVLVENPQHNLNGDFTIEQGLLGNCTEGRLTFAGIACYEKGFFNGLEAGRRALAPLLREAAGNGQLNGEVFRGCWTDVGTLKRWQSIRD